MKKENVLTEHQEQSNLIEWWSVASITYKLPKECLFAIPNSGVGFGAGGGLRGKILGALMKKEGMRSGVPDLFLAYPRGQYHGLFIEMKRTKGGVVSDNQKSMLEILKGQGYACVVCKGFMEATEKINLYLKEN